MRPRFCVFFFCEICCDGVRIGMRGEIVKPLVPGRAQFCPETLKNEFNLRIKPFDAACIK